jgi:hypothetical protein
MAGLIYYESFSAIDFEFPCEVSTFWLSTRFNWIVLGQFMVCGLKCPQHASARFKFHPIAWSTSDSVIDGLKSEL